MLKKLIQSALKRCGYQLVRVSACPTPLEQFFGMLKRQGFRPKHVIDVGANMGKWTRQALRYFPDARYTLIEPQQHLRQHVQDLFDRGYKIEWLTAGAGDKQGVLSFTMHRRHDSCSFLPTREQAAANGLAQIQVEVRTLNEVARSGDAPPPEMVKIDAEGFDLKVLAGASDLIGTTDIFLLETSIVERAFENSACAVISKMADLGYRLIDITDLNRSPKDDVLWLCEFAFLRDDSTLLDNVVSYE